LRVAGLDHGDEPVELVDRGVDVDLLLLQGLHARAAFLKRHAALREAAVAEIVEIDHLANVGEREADPLAAQDPGEPGAVPPGIDAGEAVADVAKELDLLVISDEVYEHYVTGENPHVPIASLPGMWERTITVNSFSKSWNISGWRLGYAYGKGELLAPLNNAANVIYVCPATPLQAALSRVLMADDTYYTRLRDKFDAKRRTFSEGLTALGFDIYDSGSSFYIWARIPGSHNDAIAFNEMLMRDAGVGMTPGSAFADGDFWDAHARICIAREDTILDGAMEKLQRVLR